MCRLAKDGTGSIGRLALVVPCALLLSGAEAGPSWERTWQSLPVMYLPNLGQAARPYGFVAKAPAVEIWIAQGEARIHAGGTAVTLEFEGARPGARLEAVGNAEGRANFIRGEAAVTEVPVFAGVRISELYAGIDMLYGSTGRRLKSNFLVAAGADPDQIRLRYHDADEVRIEPDGTLVVVTRDGELRESAPEAYQEGPRGREPVRAAFRMVSPQVVGFDLGVYDRRRPLTVDPELTYSTFLGGHLSDAIQAVAVNASGNAFVAGWTESSNFPVLGSMQGHGGSVDAFVAKLNASGTGLVYATFLGGSGQDRAFGIAVDGSGNAYVTGTTTSSNFPLASPAQGAFGGLRDAFAVKLNAAGSALLYGTYLGGSGSDNGNAIAVDSGGNAYLAGDTSSSNFPVQSAYQAALSGPQDAFVTKLSSTGARVYATYFGGSGSDRALSVAVDGSGQAHFGGATDSTNFPATAGAVQTAPAGGMDGFVVKLSAAGNSRIFGTYFGGASGTQANPEAVNAIAVDASGGVFLAGATPSANFPATAAYQAAGAGGLDAFVAKLNATGTTKVYVTFLGGSGTDVATGLRVDGSGNAYVSGYTGSPDFPLVDALQITCRGLYDAFVTRVNSTGTALLFSTYLGGLDADSAAALAVDSAGNAYVAGQTRSPDFPVQSAHQGSFQGTADGFVAKLSPATTAQAPVAQSVSPASGAGVSQTFTFSVSDPNGYQTIQSVYGLFQDGGTAVCMFASRPSTRQFWLLADDGASWLGPIVEGNSVTLQNAQCSLNGAATSVSGSGSGATVAAALTFTAGFSGAKQVRLMAQDAGNLTSGWQTVGSWTAGTPVNYAPQLSSATPNSGAGQTQVFQFDVSDANGYQDIRNVAIVFNSTLSGVSACSFEVHPNANVLYLAGDSGGGWASMSLGGSSSLQNSQCTISASGSSISLNGNTATMSIHVTFKAAFVGAKQFWVLPFDQASSNPGWITGGSWTVQGPVQHVPAAVSVTPSSGAGLSQSFQFVVSDGNGAADIRNVAVILNSSVSGASACYFEVHPNANRVYLANNAANSFTSMLLGATGSLQNSQCQIFSAGSSVSVSGNNATFTLNITFAQAFAGSRNIYVLPFDQGNQNPGWTLKGSWTVGTPPPSPPVAQSMNPSSGSGMSRTFDFVISDQNGYQDIRNVAIIFNNSLTGTGGCYFEVHPNANVLYLANNTVTSFSSIAIGASGSLQNSQCSISAQSSSVSLSGNTATLSINVTFQPGFSGARTVWALPFDQGNLNPGWTQLGTWNVN